MKLVKLIQPRRQKSQNLKIEVSVHTSVVSFRPQLLNFIEHISPVHETFWTRNPQRCLATRIHEPTPKGQLCQCMSTQGVLQSCWILQWKDCETQRLLSSRQKQLWRVSKDLWDKRSGQHVQYVPCNRKTKSRTGTNMTKF